MKVSAVSQGQTCSNTTFSRVDTKFSTQSSVRGSLSVINEHEPYQEVIPQLEGGHQEEPVRPELLCTEQLRCETCQTVFTNQNDFKKHDALEFCCDDCGICYSTQVEADLHVLQVHPNESYARNYIPASTKMIFAQQHRGGSLK